MIDKIQNAIKQLEQEDAALRNSYEAIINEHQQRTTRVQEIANAKMARLHQIRGALAQLRQLLNGAENPNQENQKPC